MGNGLLLTNHGDAAVLSSAVTDSELIGSAAEELPKTVSVLRGQGRDANPASGQPM